MDRPPSPHPRRMKTIYEEEKMNQNITQDIVRILYQEIADLQERVKNLEIALNKKENK